MSEERKEDWIDRVFEMFKIIWAICIIAFFMSFPYFMGKLGEKIHDFLKEHQEMKEKLDNIKTP